MDVGGALSKKYGPLPGAGWLLLIAIGVFFLLKSRQAKLGTGGSGGVGPQTAALQSGGQGNSIKYDTASTVTQTFNNGPGSGGGTFQGSFSDTSQHAGGNITSNPAPIIAPVHKTIKFVRPTEHHEHHKSHKSHKSHKASCGGSCSKCRSGHCCGGRSCRHG